MKDVLQAYLTAAEDGLLRARVVGALWWDRERGAEQIVELEERRALGQVGRFRASSVKIMQDGVVENFTAGMLDPYLDGCGCSTTNSGLSFVDPTSSLATSPTWTPRLPGPLPRTRRPCGPRGPGRAGGGPRGQRPHGRPPPPGAPAGRAPRRHPALRRAGAVANIQPLWAAHEPQMDELTIPFLGGRARPCSTPSRISSRPALGWRRAATGPCRAPTPRRHPRRGQPGRAGGRGRRGRAALPAQPDQPGHSPHRLHGRQRLREPPRGLHRPHRRRSPRRPRRARP